MTHLRGAIIIGALLIALAAWPCHALDARVAQARQLAYAGQSAQSVALWQQIADAAQLVDDPESLDLARAELADLAFQQGDYARHEVLQQQRLQTALDRHDPVREADARMALALLARRAGHLRQAHEGLQQAIEGFRAVGDKAGEGRALTHQGLVLLNQGHFAEALASLDEAQALARAGADVQLDRTYQYLGLLYLGLREYEEARRWLERGLDQAHALPDPRRVSPLLGSLARVANDQGDHVRALAYTDEAAALSTQFDSPPGLAYSSLERARALLGLERLEEASEAAGHARTLALQIGQERTAADATFVLGRIAQAKGHADEALVLFRQAIPNYEAAADAPQMLDAYRRMVPLLRERGRIAEALGLAEGALALQERLSGREAARRIALLEYRYKLADDARHIELLTRDNEIKQLRLDRQAQDRRLGQFLIAVLLGLLAVVGVAFFYSRRVGRRLAEGNRELEASRQALAAANLALEERAGSLAVAARTDALTGLANRRHVLDVLAGEAERIAGRPLSVLLMDVDRFKSINDGLGHGAGDRVLRRLAQLLSADLPSEGTLARYGGEEFLLVLPGYDLDRARQLAESLRVRVEAERAGAEPMATLSIGVACCPAGSRPDPQALVEQADRALYRAKSGGRNRVEADLRVA